MELSFGKKVCCRVSVLTFGLENDVLIHEDRREHEDSACKLQALTVVGRIFE